MTRWFIDRVPESGIPSVSLRRLLPEARFLGREDFQVSGCAADSRRLEPGQVFVALRGSRFDGHVFVEEALRRGAAGVVVDTPCAEAGTLQVVVPDTRVAHARICHALAGEPSRRMEVVGVTGGRGRRGASALLRAIFEADGRRCGSIGETGWSDGVDERPAGAANPTPSALALMLAAAVERKARACVVEASDVAMKRRGLEAVALRALVVPEILPFSPHRRLVEQILEKRRHLSRLARQVTPGGAVVVNADDPHAELLGAVNLDARRVAFGFEKPADVSGRIERLDARGARLIVRGFEREIAVELGLVGRRAAGWALAAAATAWACGVRARSVVEGLESVRTLSGRLEPAVPVEHQDAEVVAFIDDACDADELAEALADVRAAGARRLVCVLGSEGNTGVARRRRLAEAAEEGADVVLLTTDNPRGEDPNVIFDNLLAGMRRPGRARLVPDRKLAIEQAVALARAGDVVVVAGKGRRAVQIYDNHAVNFDDRAAAARAVREAREKSRRAG